MSPTNDNETDGCFETIEAASGRPEPDQPLRPVQVSASNPHRLKALRPRTKQPRWRSLRPRPKQPSGRLLEKIAGKAGQTVEKFTLIERSDRILVGLSGGKDSWTLLEVLLHLRHHAPIPFDIGAVHLELGLVAEGQQQAHRSHIDAMCERLRQLGVEAYLLETDIGKRVEEMSGSTSPCFLCARFRRGVLYRLAPQLGFTKIALGHHADDMIETLLLNQLFTGQLKSMPPRLRSDDGKNIVIRPLASVWEEETADYVRLRNLPILPSSCAGCHPEEPTRREWVKGLLDRIERHHPGTKGYLLASLGHVRVSHLLDTSLYDFVAGL